MPPTTQSRRDALRRRYQRCPIDCPIYRHIEVASLGDFFSVCHDALDAKRVYWFRGHAKVDWRLAPSALRYESSEQRERALELVTEAKRFLGMKLPRPPDIDNELEWMQVAQHYGLPTRLLDWTQNAAIALFFACHEHPDKNGLVAILDPHELNMRIAPSLSRVFNAHRKEDAEIIREYFNLGGRTSRRGKRTIAINPSWNNERIAMQNGVFTLHGSRKFDLDKDQAPSLVCVPILKEHKGALLDELERVGIGEMFIFPEPEHVCSHLRRREKLTG